MLNSNKKLFQNGEKIVAISENKMDKMCRKYVGNMQPRPLIFLVCPFILLLVLFCLSACSPTLTSTEEPVFIPEPANQFAIDKETEVETIEPTKAKRDWPQNFKLANSKEVPIGEKQFLTKINYIYNNVELFKDSTIIIEGMYGLYTSWDETFSAPMVYRNGPAEHGDDQYGGFFLANAPTDLKINDWLKVSGKPYMQEHTDSEGEKQYFMFLSVEKIEVLGLKDRKAEMVND